MVRIDPKNAAAFYRRGNAYRDKGDNIRALEDYTAAIALNPDMPAQSSIEETFTT